MNDKVRQIQDAPQLPKFGIAFGAGPHELANGIQVMAASGYIVDSDITSHTVKTGRFRKARLMCVLMVLE